MPNALAIYIMRDPDNGYLNMHYTNEKGQLIYRWIWRHLPGPWWLKSIQALVLIACTVLVLFEVVFPWANETWDLSGNANVGP